MRKIIFIIPTLRGNGAERFVLDLYTTLEKIYKATCYIICFEKRVDYKIPDDINLYYANMPKKNLFTFFFYKQLCARNINTIINKYIGNPDLILSNLTSSDKITKYLNYKCLYHVIHSITSEEHIGKRTGIKRLAAKIRIKNIYKKHPIICVSNAVKKDFIYFFYNGQKILHIYNGLDTIKIQAMSEDKTEYPLIKSLGKYILCVGNFKAAKNHISLIKGFAMAQTDANLVFLGAGGECEREIINLVKILNLENRIIFVGFHKNPYPFIRNAFLLVAPSIYEGFGIAMMEAVLLGTPIIASDCETFRELIPPSHKKCLFKAENPKSICETIDNATRSREEYIIPFDNRFRIEKIAAEYMKLTQ